jgi:hypothetical protein
MQQVAALAPSPLTLSPEAGARGQNRKSLLLPFPTHDLLLSFPESLPRWMIPPSR